MRRWEVDLTLIESWIDNLDEEEYDNVVAALEQLEEHGPVTRRPFVDTLEGSQHPNMKELRPRATKGGSHIRILFVAYHFRQFPALSPATSKMARDWMSKAKRPHGGSPVHRTPRSTIEVSESG